MLKNERRLIPEAPLIPYLMWHTSTMSGWVSSQEWMFQCHWPCPNEDSSQERLPMEIQSLSTKTWVYQLCQSTKRRFAEQSLKIFTMIKPPEAIHKQTVQGRWGTKSFTYQALAKHPENRFWYSLLGTSISTGKFDHVLSHLPRSKFHSACRAFTPSCWRPFDGLRPCTMKTDGKKEGKW